MKLRKDTASPEEWAAYLEYHRVRRLANLEHERGRLRQYNARPEVKARRKAHDSKPEIVAKRRAYAQTQEAKAKACDARALHKANNPETWAKKMAAQLEARTGFTPELRQQVKAAQKNCCAVCRRTLEGRQARADHCHDTGKPRGLLCHHCNIIEGMLRGMQLSPVEFGARLALYLESPPAAEFHVGHLS